MFYDQDLPINGMLSTTHHGRAEITRYYLLCLRMVQSPRICNTVLHHILRSIQVIKITMCLLVIISISAVIALEFAATRQSVGHNNVYHPPFPNPLGILPGTKNQNHRNRITPRRTSAYWDWFMSRRISNYFFAPHVLHIPTIMKTVKRPKLEMANAKYVPRIVSEWERRLHQWLGWAHDLCPSRSYGRGWLFCGRKNHSFCANTALSNTSGIDAENISEVRYVCIASSC